MGKGLLDILKSISIILLLSIPPWVVFRGYVKNKMKRTWMVLVFAVYMILTYFTQNFIPFVMVMIILFFNKKQQRDAEWEENEESYYLRPLGKRKIEVLIYSLVFSVIIRLLSAVYALLLQQLLKIQPKPQEVINIFMKKGWGTVTILVLMTVVFAPVLEEFIFRHILYRNISKKTGRIWGAILSSLLFTLLHFNLAGTIAFFAVGVYNCYLYEKHGYRAAVLNHFIFNFSSTFFIVLIKALNLNVGV